jgi:glucan-binding YG repeat protein
MFMKKYNKMLALLLSAAVFSASFSVSAFAEDRKKINKVAIAVDGNIELDTPMGDEELEISCSSEKYDFDYFEVQNVGFRWSIDDTPDIKIYLNAGDNYYFNIAYATDIHLTGCTYKNAWRENNLSTLVVEVTLTPLSNQVYPIETATMNGGLCTWTQSEGAGLYELKFMRGKSTLGGIQTLAGLSYDGSEYMTKAGEYHFMVRAINAKDNNVKSKWVESESVYITDAQAQAQKIKNETDQSAGQWEQTDGGWKFHLPDGSYVSGGWRKIHGQWYYFRSDSIMATGWIESGGKWYYLDQTDGYMWKNATTPDGHTVAIDGTRAD